MISQQYRRLLGETLGRYFDTCCIKGYKGPLRPPEGPAGSSVVTAGIRHVRARESRANRANPRSGAQLMRRAPKISVTGTAYACPT
jgi:hypothetical protein